MNTRRVVTTSVLVGSVATAAHAASVTVVTDNRAVETTAWAGEPFSPVPQAEHVASTGQETFDETVNLDLTSPGGTISISTIAQQFSSVSVLDDGSFEITGSLGAHSAASREFGDGPFESGFGSPRSIFDLTLDVEGHFHWELVLTMETAGDAAASFDAFDASFMIDPLGSSPQLHMLAGDIFTGTYRILADVMAPTDPFLGGSGGSVDFTLRGSVAAPIPSAFAAAGAMMAAALFSRRRRG